MLAFCLGASAQSYTESFEGWDGATPDWMPEGWAEWHTDDIIPTLSDGSFTWHVINPDNSKTLPKATDGRYYAAIGYAKNDQNEDLYQDEWLISPAFKLSEYGGTLNFDAEYAPLFLFRVDNGYVDWSEMDFTDGVRVSSADFQVLVRRLTADGEWDEFWEPCMSLFADWRTQPLSALMSADFYSSRFHQVSTIFFTDECYHGATIQVAFRYVGQYGKVIGFDKFFMNYATKVDDAPSVDGIPEVRQTPSVAAIHPYDLWGRPAAKSCRGVSLIQMPDGQTRKVMH